VDWSHFGADRPAFRPAVDPSAYYPAHTHEAARHALEAAFVRREPAVLIDGPTGVGKSLVARKWLDDLMPLVPRVVLPAARAERPADLLQALLFDMGKPYAGLSEQELRLSATGHLLDAAAGGFPTVLVLDEAQGLSQPALEELRTLFNLEARGAAAVFAVLVAHPMLRDAFRRAAYAPIADRVAVRCAVDPLSVEDSVAYLCHQLRAAGANPERVLDGGAAALLAAACGGVPRTLNQAATGAFALARAAGAPTVDVEAALGALEQLEIEAPDGEAADGDAPAVLPLPAREKAAEGNERAAARGSKERVARRRTA
jgi:type II secretory pathway predicted ATPase ExeA